MQKLLKRRCPVTSTGIELHWNDRGDASYYVIYRCLKDEVLNTENPAHIVAIVQRQPYTTQRWIDHATRKRTSYTYGITAVDRLHNESKPAKLLTITTRGRRGSVKGS
jgi:hypothetical protein